MDIKLLELYSDYIISSFGQITAKGLFRVLSGNVSHDKITRFLSQHDLDSKELWELVKPVVTEHEQENGVLIVDDTIEKRPHPPESELICWHHDHQSNRSVKGVNIINYVYSLEAIDKKRWKVEVFHQTLKSNTGLAKSPTKCIRTQTNHIFMSISRAIAYKLHSKNHHDREWN
jgi:DDE superfamily endonuclease